MHSGDLADSEWNETKQMVSDETATWLVSKIGVLGVFSEMFYQKVSQGPGWPAPFTEVGWPTSTEYSQSLLRIRN